MGNRACIVTENKDIGIYLHYYGGLTTVTAFLEYCRIRGFRTPESDNYGWARLCQVIGNYIGGDLSLGIDKYSCLDKRNGDNGTYVIRDWKIVKHKYCSYGYTESLDMRAVTELVLEIDKAQPEKEQIGELNIVKELETMYV